MKAKLFVTGRNDNYQLTNVKNDVEQYGLPIIQIPKSVVTNNIPKELACVSSGCSHSVFIDKEGNIYGVGDDVNCQIGSKQRKVHKDPVEIKMNYKIVWAACGYDYTMYLADDGRLIYCGRGMMEKIIILPKGAAFVTASSDSACAIDRIGDIHIFSRNIEENPKHVKLPDPVYDIARSNFFTIAVTVDGVCYGNGDLNLNDRSDEFVEIDSLKSIRVARVYAFGRNACAVAVDGRVFMRGPGSFGELGNGECKDSDTFVQCYINEVVMSASLGQSFALFVTKGGSVYGCGKNTLASLMLGTREGKVSIPAKSMCLKDKATYACCGNYHSFVVADNKISHPGVSFFDVKMIKDVEETHENNSITDLYNFLGFTPDF